MRDLVARTNEPCNLGLLAAGPPSTAADAAWEVRRLRHVRRNASGEEGKDDEGECPEVEGDHISALPDVLLNHVLSLLPAEEAVRTCVLAQRWRHLWKSTTGLRIGYLGKYEQKSVNVLRKFVDYLLLLRGGLPLDEFNLRLGGFAGPDDVPRVNLWLRHAVTCKVRVLKIHVYKNEYINPWLELDDLPLVSKHLTRLQLHGVQCQASFLNFSSCPALEHLEFVYCDVSLTKKISSEFLKSLRITNSVFTEDSRIRICAPNLVSLHLDDLWFNTPILESMPGLVKAFVRITEQCWDRCSKLWNPHQDCDCEFCDSSGNSDGVDNCVLLKGLSEAKDLVLISQLHMFTFERDLRWCPTFNKLKTLLLNGYWCIHDDLHALACILEHSPNLVKLTLQLFSEGRKHKVEMNGSFSSMERSPAISEHLKIVEVKCEAIDERVLKVLQFLCTFSIRFSF